MKLFFCDICNESIPLQDIKDNRATTIKGKIFCRACNPLNELAATEAPAAVGASAGASSGGASTASLAMLYVGVVAALGASGYLLWEKAYRSADTGQLAMKRVETVESNLGDTKQDIRLIKDSVAELAALRVIPKGLETLQEEQARIKGEIEKVNSSIAAAEKNLNTVGTLRESLDKVTLRQDEFAGKLGRLEGIVSQMQSQLKEVADRPPVLVAPNEGKSEAGTPANGGSGAEAQPPLDAKLTALIEKLGSSDPMVRWEAVDQIRAAKEKALIPHVVKLLADRDTFVRAQAIYTLGELKATKAVPDLVKLLRDDEQMIREESLVALNEITNANIKFDMGNKAEREKGVKKWEDWLAKNKDSLGSGG